MQLVLAGSDLEGLRYGPMGIPKKFCIEWKERKSKGAVTSELLAEGVLLDLICNFLIFDGWQKKVPRVYQHQR